MKDYVRLALVIICFSLLLVSGKRVSAGLSDEQRFARELSELEERKQDFERRRKRDKELDAQREAGAEAVKRRRAKEDEQVEEARQAFIRHRDAQPASQEDRLEAAFNLLRQKEDEQLEMARQRYVQSRNRRTRVLEHGAVIDENQEYDIYYSDDDNVGDHPDAQGGPGERSGK